MHALEVTFHATFLCPTRRLSSPQTISKNTLHKSLITGKLLFKYFDNRMYSSENWNAADSEARRHLTGESIYIHPFDGKEIWNGHATIIDELKGKLIIPWYWMARKIMIFIIRNMVIRQYIIRKWNLLIWKDQMRGQKPGLLVCSVGGGGLLAGLILGLERNGWDDVPSNVRN